MTKSGPQKLELNPGTARARGGGTVAAARRLWNIAYLCRPPPLIACRAVPEKSRRPTISWGGELPDARIDDEWAVPLYDSDAEIEEEVDAESLNAFGPPGFGFQNALATVLLAALALSLLNVLLKLAVVAFALVSAAFRYSVIGILAIVILAIFS